MALPDSDNDHVLVISPVRNEVSRVYEMFVSLRDQSHTNWTLCFGDNASEDGTSEVIRRIVREDPRCRVMTFSVPVPIHENFNRTIEWALQSCNHDFVQFLAADDKLGGELYFKSALRLLKESSALMACGLVRGFSDAGELETIDFHNFAGLTTWPQRERFASNNYWVCNLLFGFFSSGHFKKTVSASVSSFTSNLSSDWWFAYGASMETPPAYSSDLLYLKYRKDIPYSSVHYSIRENRAFDLPSWAHVFVFPWKQLGDRVSRQPIFKSLRLVTMFQFREIKTLLSVRR